MGSKRSDGESLVNSLGLLAGRFTSPGREKFLDDLADMTRAAMNYRERLSVRPEGTELTPDDVSLLTERFQQAYKARGALDEAVAVALDFCRKVY